MIRRLFMMLAILASFAGVAKADHWGYCSQYNDPSQCASDRNCKYDWLYRSCVDSGVPGGGNGGGNRSCSSYDQDPNLCNDQAQCEFDTRWNRCTDRSETGRDACSRWDSDAFTCNNVSGCGFDTWSRRCVANGQGPNSGGSLQTIELNCASSFGQYQRCPVYGQVVEVYLTGEESFNACRQNVSWGYDQDGVYVKDGCRANFQVRYYAR